jgi:hypothetical protein
MKRRIATPTFALRLFAALLALSCLTTNRVHADGSLTSLRWRWSNPSPHGNNVVDMAYENGVAVQVAEKGQIYTTEDMATWTPRTSGTSKALRSVTFFNGNVIITGEAGTVLKSSDHINYQLFDLGTADWLEGVTAMPGLLVAAGDNGAIHTSPDAANWTSRNSGTTEWLRSVAYGLGLAIAVGENGTIRASSDGVNWSSRTSGTTEHLNRISFQQNKFWIAGENGVTLDSLDGTTWLSNPTGAAGANDLHAIVGDAGSAILVAGESEGWLTENGPANWTNQLALTGFPLSDATYYTGVHSGDFFTLAGRTGAMMDGFKVDGFSEYIWLEQNESTRNWLWETIRTPELYVSVGDRGTVMTSPQGIDWTTELVPTNLLDHVLLGVGGTTNLIFAVGTAGNMIYSTNTLVDVISTNITTDGMGMSVTNFTTNALSQMGIIWTDIPSPDANDLQGVTEKDGTFVVSGGGGTILTSTDNGANWTLRTTPTAEYLSGVTSHPGGFVAVGDNGTIITSVDSVNWTAQSSGTANWVFCVRWLNGQLVAVGQNGTVLTSPDGADWTARASGTTKWLNDVAFVNDIYFAVGTSGTALCSSDSINWSNIETITFKSFYGVAGNGKQLVVTGIEGIVLRAQTELDLTPIDIASYTLEDGNSAFFFVGNPDQQFTLHRSDDGVDFQIAAHLEFTDSAGTLIHFEESSNACYTVSFETGDIRTAPSITWAPGPITYGTVLGANELNAVASVPGTFSYSLEMGTLLTVGVTNLSVIFKPDDGSLYKPLVKNVAIAINPATLRVIAHDKTRTYGDSNPTLTFDIMDFVNGEDAAVLTTSPIIETTGTTFSDAGIYPITPSGGGAVNYLFNHIPALLTVQQRGLNIGVEPASREYGRANPAFIPTYAGFIGGELPADLDVSPTFTTAADEFSPVDDYVISVAGASDVNYAITHANGVMTIQQAPLIITAENKGKAFGDANPTLTATYFGFLNGETSGVLDSPVSLSTTATQGSPAGSYPVTAVGAMDNNYSITHINGSLTIGTSILTITANPATRVYGATHPMFSVEYVGFQGGDDESALDTPVSFTTTATVNSPTGQYAITPGGATDGNYTLVFVDGAMDVTPAPLGITANNTSRAYGVSNPPFAVTYSGFVAGDDANDLDTPVIAMTTATSASQPKMYPISPSAAADANYSITFVNGMLTVIKGTLIVTAVDQSRPYGDDLPLTVSYMGFVNDEDESALDTLPTVSSAATATSPVGGYTLTASGATAANYNTVHFTGTLTVTKAPLGIRADDLFREFGVANPTLAATYTGFVNGEDENVLDTPVSLSTTATAVSPLGAYPITAFGALDANYEITHTNGTLTIAQAILRIRAIDAARIYGDSNPTFTLTYEGFAPGDDESSLDTPATVATTATSASPATTYDIVPSSADDANYTIVFENGTLTVTPAPLTIRPMDASRLYGATNPTFAGIYMTFKNGDDESALDTPPTFSTTATPASPIAGYAITASGAADVNYTISFEAGNLDVTPVPLTITAVNTIRLYGADNPTFTSTYMGFVNGDMEASLDTPPSYSTSAGPTSGVDAYTVTPSGAADVNYTISYVNGMLEIFPAPLTITAINKTRTYGAANPTLTAGYLGFVNDEDKDVLTNPVLLSAAADSSSPVGEHDITASGATAANYAISHVEGKLTVEPATLTARAENKARSYGDANPPLTIAYTDFVNGETSAVLTELASATTTADAASPVADYVITASGGAAANYQINHVNGLLSVTPINVMVRAENKFRNYGAADPTFTATYDGFINGATKEDLATPVSFTSSATLTSPAALYTITPSGASHGNYTFTYQNGFLVITAAPLTIAAHNQTKFMGEANPPLTLSYVGFANGEDESVLSSSAQVTTTASQASPIGQYPITVAGAEAVNYTITFQSGALYVNPPIVPSVLLTAPVDNAIFFAPANIVLSADASITEGSIVKVEFFNGAIKLGEDATAPFNFAWNGIGLGSYDLTALAIAESGAATISPSVSISAVPGVNSVQITETNEPQVALTGEIGVTYLVQASDDLIAWMTVGMITGNGTTQSFVEEIQASMIAARFYRIIEAP